jgi:hypothetical protein
LGPEGWGGGGGAAALYAQPDDRWEVNDVRQIHLETAEELERILASPERERGEFMMPRDMTNSPP